MWMMASCRFDNGVAERAMRPIAIGRKNWMFGASPAAGSRAAVLMSLFASCKSNQVEPWAYLRDVLSRLALKPTETQLEATLHSHWLPPNTDGQSTNHGKPKKTEGEIRRALTTHLQEIPHAFEARHSHKILTGLKRTENRTG